MSTGSIESEDSMATVAAGAGAGTGIFRHSVDFPATGTPPVGNCDGPRVNAFAQSSDSAVSPGSGKKSPWALASGLLELDGGGPIASGTGFSGSERGDPESADGTDLPFFFLPGIGIIGPAKASSMEQYPLLIP